MAHAAPSFWTTHQAAGLLGVSLQTVANWVDGGKLPAHRTPGGHRRILEEDLFAFARAHSVPISLDGLRAQKRAVRVLVVDDEHDFTMLVQESLTRHELLTVDIAESGFAAGLAVARFHPDVILLDLMMPDIDGFEVFRLLQADDQTRRVPVIACSAFDDHHLQQRVAREGFAGFLGKPVSFRDLPAVLLRAVGIDA